MIKNRFKQIALALSLLCAAAPGVTLAQQWPKEPWKGETLFVLTHLCSTAFPACRVLKAP